MRSFAHDVPWFLPGVALCVAIGIIVSPAVARFLQTRTAIAFLLVVSAGTILLATLSPTLNALAGRITSKVTCDISRLGPATISELTSPNDITLNVALFIPLGLALGLLPPTPRNLVLVIGAFGLTLVVEGTQMLMPMLGRDCESADVIDNTMGLILGLFAGNLLRLTLERLRRYRSD